MVDGFFDPGRVYVIWPDDRCFFSVVGGYFLAKINENYYYFRGLVQPAHI